MTSDRVDEIRVTTFPTGSDEPSLFVLESKSTVVCVSVVDGYWQAYRPDGFYRIAPGNWGPPKAALEIAERWLKNNSK